MTNTSIYQDIATRTNGDIYIGVVGPVRTGKSTFIKRFMETLVIPNIDNVYARDFVCQGLRGHDYFDHSAEGNRNPVLAQEMGTRAHALALCVAYDSPLQTICDWPERYRNASGAEILRDLPTVWRNTHPVCGEIGSHYAVLRESFAGDFYFAAFSVGPRKIPLAADFLGDGTWEMTQYVADPVRTPTDAKALAILRRTVVKGETLSFDVLAEGGAVVVFRKVK